MVAAGQIQFADLQHPFPVGTEIRSPDSGRAAEMDLLRARVDQKLDVIDKAEYQAGRLRPQVFMLSFDDFHAWHFRNRRLDQSQRIVDASGHGPGFH